MANPFLGEIRAVGFNFAPVGWAKCEGQVLPISQFDNLFNLIGTTYGGDGESTFCLPDLRGRVGVGQGQSNGTSNYVLGQFAGTEEVTLTSQTMPAHGHAMVGSNQSAPETDPGGHLYGIPYVNARLQNLYAQGLDDHFNSGVVGFAGGNQPHNNMAPYTVITFIICLEGIFPSPN